MSKTQKIITAALWGVLLLAMAGVVAAKFLLPKGHAEPEVLYPAAAFALTDQDNKPFGHQDLKGRPYVAAFVFTQCGSTCPRMTADMAAIQKDLPPEVRLVSFSVDPERDTPEVLKRYAATYKADEARWRFLTGPYDEIKKVAQGMMVDIIKKQEGDHPILHSERLFLVDGENRVRKLYHSRSADDVKQLVVDAKYLASHPGK